MVRAADGAIGSAIAKMIATDYLTARTKPKAIEFPLRNAAWNVMRRQKSDSSLANERVAAIIALGGLRSASAVDAPRKARLGVLRARGG